MLADGINISSKSLFGGISGRQHAGEQMNKTCTLVCLVMFQADELQNSSTAASLERCLLF